MAIKKLRFSFDLPIEQILALVATRNDALHIDVVGDGKPDKIPKQLRNGAAVAGLLEGPKEKKPRGNAGVDEHGNKITATVIMVKAMFANPDMPITQKILQSAVVERGLSKSTTHSQLYSMRVSGYVAQTPEGYKLTTKGKKHFAHLTQGVQS